MTVGFRPLAVIRGMDHAATTMKVFRPAACLFLLGFSGCGDRTQHAVQPEGRLLLFDDPGPIPARTDRLFKGTNWKGPADAPNGDIAASLLACGARELKITNAGMDHSWSVAVRRPSPLKPFLTCVARHAGPMVFRVREVSTEKVR